MVSDKALASNFIWHPHTNRHQVARRIIQQHEAGANHPERTHGRYNLAGEGSGYLLVEYNDPRELTAFLSPYMDLMSFDMQAVEQLYQIANQGE